MKEEKTAAHLVVRNGEGIICNKKTLQKQIQ